MEHTKVPWTIESPCGFPYSGIYIVPVVRKDFPFYIAQIRQLREREESEANAEHIVRCVNSHDALLEACGMAKAWFDKHTNDEPVWEDQPSADMATLMQDAIAQAQK